MKNLLGANIFVTQGKPFVVTHTHGKRRKITYTVRDIKNVHVLSAMQLIFKKALVKFS